MSDQTAFDMANVNAILQHISKARKDLANAENLLVEVHHQLARGKNADAAVGYSRSIRCHLLDALNSTARAVIDAGSPAGHGGEAE